MKRDDIKITNTTMDDFPLVLWLFEQAMELQGQNGYKVWKRSDKGSLENDIADKLRYKISSENDIICIFSIQLSDPLIWRDRDKNDAIYLHRIVVHPNYKGQRYFEKVLDWAKQYVRQNDLRFIDDLKMRHF